MLQKFKANIDWDAISDCIIDDSLMDNILEVFKDNGINEQKMDQLINQEVLKKAVCMR